MDRAVLMELRKGLMITVAALEQALGMDRRCPHCGKPVTVGNQARG